MSVTTTRHEAGHYTLTTATGARYHLQRNVDTSMYGGASTADRTSWDLTAPDGTVTHHFTKADAVASLTGERPVPNLGADTTTDAAAVACEHLRRAEVDLGRLVRASLTDAAEAHPSAALRQLVEQADALHLAISRAVVTTK